MKPSSTVEHIESIEDFIGRGTPVSLDAIDCDRHEDVLLFFSEALSPVGLHDRWRVYLLNGVLLSCTLQCNPYPGAAKSIALNRGLNPRNRRDGLHISLDVAAGTCAFAFDHAVVVRLGRL